MRGPSAALVVALAAVAVAPPVEAQDRPSADSLSLVVAGTEAGSQAGRTASLRGPRWGSAAATFFLTPFVGGVGSLVAAELPSGGPPVAPDAAGEASSPVYQRAYRAAYREAYRPRQRRAVRTSVLVTSILFFAGAAVFAG